MQSAVSHIQFNIDPSNIGFYKELLDFLGWSAIFEAEGMGGFKGKGDASLWFMPQAMSAANDYDGPGMNHLAIGVEAQSDVDEAARYLSGKGVETLFDTPRHRPEFAMGEGQTYYQVMFKSPDNILLEVVYTGPKAA